MERRNFLQLSGLAAGALMVPGWDRHARPWSGSLTPIPVADKKALADAALNAAKSRGASYADVRIGRYLNQFINGRETKIQGVTNTESFGAGVRVIADGTWGFAATQDVTPDGMARAVAEGSRDLAIGPFVRPARAAGSEIAFRPLFQERQAMFCAKGHPLFGRRKITLDDVRSQPFVARRYLNRYDLEITGHMKAAAIVEQMEAQAALILSGRYIGFLPIHYAALIGRDGRLQKLPLGQAGEYESPFYLLHKKQAEENVVLRSFLNRVDEQLKREPR